MKETINTLRVACKDLEEDLVLYYYGDNSAVERRRVENHLESCSPCREFLDDLRNLLPTMAKPSELPRSFWDNYYRETVAKLAQLEARKFHWRNVFAPMRGWMLPAFGTAGVAIFALALGISRGNWHFTLSQPRTTIPQEVLADTNQLEFFKSMDMLESLSKLEALDGTKLEAGNSQS